MSLTGITRDETYLHKTGSAYMAGREVLSTGQPLGTPDTVFKNFGFLADFVYDRAETEAGEADVAGVNHNNTTTTVAKLTTKIMQRDAVTINLPKNHLGYTRIVAECTQVKLGASATKGQVLIITAAKLPSGIHIDMKDLYPQWEWACNPKTGAAVTEDLTAFTGFLGAGVGTPTIGNGEYELFVEFTYP